jgi:hypothetical protein
MAPGAMRAGLTNSLRDTEPSAFWLDCADRPELTTSALADLVIVGGGFRQVGGYFDGWGEAVYTPSASCLAQRPHGMGAAVGDG